MKTGNYSIGDIRLLVKSAVNQRSNRSWTLLLVKSGSGMYTIDGRLCCLNENDILFFPPHSVYSFASADLGDEYNESLDAVVLRFEDLWFESLLRTFPQLGDLVLRLKEVKGPVALTGSKWFSVYSLLNQLQSAQPERESLIILDLLHHLSAPSEFIPLSKIPDYDMADIEEKKSRIDRYISCNLISGISLDDIASYAGMNRPYFCLFFKKHYGKGLVDHINTKKIDLACTMLSTTDESIAAIARQCGFRNVTYFNRVFKAAKGVSPKEHRISSCL